MTQFSDTDPRWPVAATSTDAEERRPVASAWNAEHRQFDALLRAAHQGKALPALMVAGRGRGKTSLLSRLITGARADGDVGLHVHLDRYFSPQAFLLRFARRLTHLNGPLAQAVVPLAISGPEALHDVIGALDKAVAEAGQAAVFGVSGWEAHLDLPVDRGIFDMVAGLLERAREHWRHTLFVAELRAGDTSPELDDIRRGGLVHFPVSEPAQQVIEDILRSAPGGQVRFRPTIASMAAARARGNLHVLVASMHDVAARAAAAGITDVGPVEWEALSRGIHEDLPEIELPECTAVLQALADWPAAGYVPVEEVAWRLRAIGGGQHSISELKACLAGSPLLAALGPHGDPGHFAFTWPEVRRALTAALSPELTNPDILQRRTLQAGIADARWLMHRGDVAAAVESVRGVVARARGPEDSAFRDQACALAADVWHGVGVPEVDNRLLAAPVLVQLGGDAAARALARGLGSPQQPVRRMAAESLASMGAAVAAYVAEYVRAGEMDTRLEAVDLLGRLGGEQALEAVLAVATDTEAPVRLAAIGAVRRMRAEAGGPVVAGLATDPDAAVRVAAIQCLGVLAFLPALEVVTEALADEVDDVRVAASEALASIGDEKAVPALMARLLDERAQVRVAAARALSAFGEPALRQLHQAWEQGAEGQRLAVVRGIAFFPAANAIPVALRGLREPGGDVQQAAAECLAGVGQLAVTPTLELLRDPEGAVRGAAARALALIGEPAVLPLQDLLADADPVARSGAAHALGEMRHEASVELLCQTARDADFRVRLVAINALRNIETEAALGAVVQAMSDGDERVGAAAIRLVGSLGAAGVEPLLGHLTGPDLSPVPAVVEALVGLGAEATMGLCTILEVGPTYRRLAALEVLGRTLDPLAADALVGRLHDPQLRSRAGDIIAALGEPCIPPLMVRLGVESDEEREAVVAVAARLGRLALEPAIAVLQSAENRARAAAADILGRLRYAEAVNPLTMAVRDEAAEVRAAAVRSLGAIQMPDTAVLLASTARDQAPEVVAAAAWALAQFGLVGTEALLGEFAAHQQDNLDALVDVVGQMPVHTLDDLVAVLRSESDQLRAGALNLLGRVAYEPALPHLVERLSDTNAAVARCAHAAVVSFGPAAAPALRDLLVSAGPSHYDQALAAMLEIGAPAVTYLLELLEGEAAYQEVAAQAIAAFGQVAIPGLAEVLATSQRTEARRLAAGSLADVGSPSAVPYLTAALADTDAEVRIACCGALARTGDHRSVPAVLDLLTDPDPRVAAAADRAIAAFGEQAVTALVDALDSEVTQLRSAASRMLAAMPEPAVPALIGVLPGSSSQKQATAIEVLRAIGAPESAAPVLDLLTAEDPAGAAARAYATALPEVCLVGLVERISAGQWDMRQAAAQVCVAIGVPAVAALAGALQAGSDEGKVVALGALASIGDESVLPAVISAANDLHPDVRTAVAAALGELMYPDGAPVLCRLLTDTSRQVRETSATALGRFGVSGMVALVYEYDLQSRPASDLLLASLSAMGPVASNRLEDLVVEGEGDLRAGALNLLVALGDTSLVRLLPGLLADETPQVRAALRLATAALGELALPAMAEGLLSGSESAAALAGDCLVDIGEPAVAPLANALLDRTCQARARALEVLGRIGSAQAVEPLLSVMAEGPSPLADAALEAILAHGEVGVPVLLGQMDATDEGLRDAVRRVLALLGDAVRPAMLQILAGDSVPRQVAALGVLRGMGASEATPLAADLIAGPPELSAAARELLLAFPEQAVQALRPRLGAPSAELRQASVELMVTIGGPAVETLSSAAVTDEVPARLSAVQALRAIGGEQARFALSLVATDQVAEVRAAAVDALGHLGVIPIVVSATHDPEARVREAAIAALVPHGRAALDAIFRATRSAPQPADPETVAAIAAFDLLGVDFLREQLDAEGPESRCAAARILAAVGPETAFNDIVRLLGDPEGSVRAAAVDALVEGAGAAVPALTRLLVQGPSPVQPLAADCLARIGDPAVAALVDAELDRTTPDRGAAIRVLARIAPPHIHDHLIAWLSDPAETVRIAAADSLALMGHEPALPALLEGVDEDTVASREARLAAVQSFGETAVPFLVRCMEDPTWSGSPSLARALAALGDAFEESMLAMLGDSQAHRRLLAVRALRNMGCERAADQYLRLVADLDPAVRSEAALALADLPARFAMPLLDHMADPDRTQRGLFQAAIALQGDELLDVGAANVVHESAHMRLASLELLALAARPRDLTSVTDALRDPDAAVRGAACRAVVSFASRPAAEALLPVLDDSDPAVAEAAMAAIAALGDLAYEVLVPRLVGADGSVDARVVRALSAGGATAEPILRECLTREAPGVRVAAARALCSLAGEAAVPDLVPLLSDSAEPVRDAVVAALISLGPASAAPALQVIREATPPGCLAAAEVVGAVGASQVDELISILRMPQPRARAAAVWALGKLGDERAGTHLVIRLRDPDPSVRVVAAMSLGTLGWSKAVPHLVSVLDDDDVRVATAAIGSLAQIGQPALEGLIARMVMPDGAIRDDVVYALSAIGDPAVEPLLNAAANGGPTVRLAVVRALALIASPATVLALAEALTADEAALRREALRGLRAAGRAAVPELVRRLNSEAPAETMEPLIEALAQIQEPSLPEVSELFDRGDEGLWKLAAETLGRMGMPAASALRRAMSHHRVEVRTLAVEGVARIGDVSMVPDLIDVLDEEDTGLVGAAIRALADLGDSRAVLPIVRRMGARSPAVREALAYALDRFGAEFAPPLADLITADDRYLAEQATNALLLLGKSAEPALTRKLSHEEPLVRCAAARVMGQLDSHATVEPLIGALSDPDSRVREAAATALGAIGANALSPVLDRMAAADEALSDAILLALRHMAVDPIYSLMERAREADEPTRLAAVRMAGRFGRSEAIATLQQRLHDTSLEINCAAATALGEIGSEEALEKLAEVSVTAQQRLAATVRDILSERAESALPILVRLASRRDAEPNPAFIEVATEVARQAPGVVDELISDSDEAIRRAAAVVLGSIGDDTSLRALVRRARDADAPVRRAAAVALGRMGENAVRPLTGLLSDPDEEVRRSAAEVLASVRPAGVNVLVRQLEHSRDEALRVTICAVLGEGRVTAATGALRAVAAAASSEGLAVAASAALAMMGQGEGELALQDALRSPDEQTRATAAAAMARLGGHSLSAVLPLVDDSSPLVREAAIQVFRHVGARDIPMVLQYAQHADPQVRAIVATTMREAPRDPDALAVCLALLRDDDHTVCDAAVESLAMFGDDALEALGREALSRETSRRYAACWALGQLGSRAVATLLQLSVQAEPALAADVLRALGRIGDPRGREAVLASLRHEDARVRVAAVGAMRRLATPGDTPSLAAALADTDGNVRTVAVSVASALMTDELRQAVLTLLDDRSGDVRAAAAQVLRQDANPAALTALRRAFSREPEPWVAELIEGAILAIGG